MVDDAALLSAAQEAVLVRRSAALQKATGRQFVVVTLPSLQGRSIEQVGLALGNGWQIGRKGVDDGVLLIVAPTERKVRIEVGCGLEAALTDRESETIIQKTVLPRFRQGRMAQGIATGSDAILREINQ